MLTICTVSGIRQVNGLQVISKLQICSAACKDSAASEIDFYMRNRCGFLMLVVATAGNRYISIYSSIAV